MPLPAEFSGDSGVFGLLVFGPLVNPGFQGGLVQRSAPLSIHYVDVGPGCAQQAEHGHVISAMIVGMTNKAGHNHVAQRGATGLALNVDVGFCYLSGARRAEVSKSHRLAPNWDTLGWNIVLGLQVPQVGRW